MLAARVADTEFFRIDDADDYDHHHDDDYSAVR